MQMWIKTKSCNIIIFLYKLYIMNGTFKFKTKDMFDC